MSNYAIIPVKSLKEAKSRLGKTLRPEERIKITWEMLRHVVNTCKRAGLSCFVVSPDEEVISWSERNGCLTLQDPSPLNNAVEMAVKKVMERADAEYVLVVFSDLPLLSVNDLRNILSLVSYCEAVLCPDLRLDGTNILALKNIPLFKPQYGSRSFEKHLNLFNSRRIKVFVSLGTGLDLDTEKDLTLLKEMGLFKIPY